MKSTQNVLEEIFKNSKQESNEYDVKNKIKNKNTLKRRKQKENVMNKHSWTLFWEGHKKREIEIFIFASQNK